MREAKDMKGLPHTSLNGWFAVCEAAELRGDRPLTTRLFGEELVLFRDASGAPRALDAHCPHMGAHLGDGRVIEGALACPFHSWRFDGEGTCVRVPFARKIPPRARVASWPTRENAGMVLVWRHAQRAPPSYELPDLEAEFGSLRHTRRFTLDVNASLQSMNENGLDLGHFSVIHAGKQRTGFRGHPEIRDIAIDRARMRWKVASDSEVLGREMSTLWRMECFGPTAFIASSRDPIPTDALVFYQPLEAELTRGHFLITPRLKWSLANRLIKRAAARRTRWEVEQDRVVWDRQRYRLRPVLSDADGPIMQYRGWMRQFYAEAPSPALSSSA